VKVSSPAAMELSITSEDAGCTGATGTATANITGGNPPFTYAWSNGQISATATELGSGSYTVTVTDSAGCTAEGSVKVSSPAAMELSITSEDAGCTGATGSATANITGGNPPFTYAWSNGQNTTTATELGAGSYTVTVTDSAGCTAEGSVQVSSPAAMELVVSSTDAGCNENKGSAQVEVKGGTSPYSYAWSSGQTGPTATDLASGEYTLTVTDSMGV
jgi:hypothetical protein